MPSKRQLDKLYLNIAHDIRELSKCKRNRVGCVIVKNNNILSMGYNGTPSGMDNECEEYVFTTKPTHQTKWYVLHAESNAIAKLAKSTQTSDKSTLYTTVSPCPDCAKLIIQSGIRRVVFMEMYRDGEKALELFEKNGVEWQKQNNKK